MGKYFRSTIVAIATVLGVLYISIWWGVISPIMTVATAIDSGTLSAHLVAYEVIKFFLREGLAAIVGYSGFIWYIQLVTKGK